MENKRNYKKRDEIPLPPNDMSPAFLEYLNEIRDKNKTKRESDYIERNYEFLEKRERVVFNRKTVKRIKAYTTKTLKRRCLGLPIHSYSFVYSGIRQVTLIGLEFNNLGTYFYLPEDSITAVLDLDTKKWTALPNFYKGMRFKPNEEMLKVYPGMFKPNETYKITNDVLTIYYSFKERKDLTKLALYLIFQQVKTIYRKKHEKQRYKSI